MCLILLSISVGTVSLPCPVAALSASLCFYSPSRPHHLRYGEVHFSICNSYFPQFKYKSPYLICLPSVFLLPSLLIWPFWKEISTDVHSLNNKADHPPPLPQLTNNKPTVTGILYSFARCMMWKTWCVVKKKKKPKGFTSSSAARLVLSVIWKLSLIILSDGFLSQGQSVALQHRLCRYP